MVDEHQKRVEHRDKYEAELLQQWRAELLKREPSDWRNEKWVMYQFLGRTIAG